MKKIGYICVLHFLLSTSAIATPYSTVRLNGGGDVLPSQSVRINLSPLFPSAAYTIICYIDTKHPFQVVRLGSHVSDQTSHVTYSLNGDDVIQGQLKVGHNVAVFVGNFTTPSTASVDFANLDQDNSFNVNNCYATPLSK